MFWERLKKPFFALAPMADVTDAAFRRIIAKYSAHRRADGTVGAADVTWTEFVSADGLVCATQEGKQKLLADLIYGEEERPIVAQLFSSNPAHMEEAAALCRGLGFDGIDINMGCPDRSIEKQGCGAAMIKNPERACEIIAAAKRGAPNLPVSVKTRIGYTKDELDTWLPALLLAEPAAVAIHARTRKEMSNVPAQWERIKRAVEIRNACDSKTLIIGNGDAVGLEDARAKARASGADGVMLGRAIFGNPWLFHPEKDAVNVSLEEKLRVMVEHTTLFAEMLPHKSLAIMKKHYKAYVQGFDGAHALRARLMEAENAREIETLVEAFIHDTPRALLDSSATL
ncbi:tRNA-dihydrouridine synthase [Candidatus Kaiserbacteria bacterium]|nr:tRNA-dihydrouridine synthase [Candidatus Kaiserbacteria bacterium]